MIQILLDSQETYSGVTTISLLGYQVSKGTIRPDPERFEALRKMDPPNSAKSQQRIIGLFSYYSQWISHFSDKIRVLSQNTIFPLPSSVKTTFENLKEELEKGEGVAKTNGVWIHCASCMES